MMLPNHALARTAFHHGRTVLAMDGVLGGAQWQQVPGAQWSC